MKNRAGFVLLVVTLVLSMTNSAFAFQELSNSPQEDYIIDPTATSPLAQSIFDFEIIPLGVNEEVLLPKIRILGVFKNRIFVTSHQLRRNKVYVFDQAGKYINTIDIAGQGPGEYTAISNVIALHSDKFALQDIMGQKLIEIDANGEYLSEIKLSVGVNSITKIEGGYAASVRDEFVSEKGAIVIYDKQFKLKNSFLYREPVKGPIANNSNLVSLADGFAYLPFNETGVYHGTQSEVWSAYYFDFGRFNPELTPSGVPQIKDKVALLSLSESNSHLFLNYTLGFGNHILTAVQKESGFVINTTLKEVIGDDLPGFSASDSEWFYLPVSSYFTEKLFKSLSVKDGDLTGGVTLEKTIESENPVILKVKFF